MTPKGLPHVDLEIAEPAVERAVGRRTLIGRASVAGLAGAAALLVSSNALAAPAGEDPPNVPTAADEALLEAALAFELVARDLYKAFLDAGRVGELADIVKVMTDNHEAFAQAIAGTTGLSAGDFARDDDLFDSLVAGFTGSDFAANAHALEQTGVATHTDLIGQYESKDALALTASILIVEARHATVLASILDVDDLDTLFGNDQDALELSGGDA